MQYAHNTSARSLPVHVALEEVPAVHNTVGVEVA